MMKTDLYMAHSLESSRYKKLEQLKVELAKVARHIEARDKDLTLSVKKVAESHRLRSREVN
jgi:hypothetical protein